jgi:hypothetical protein
MKLTQADALFMMRKVPVIVRDNPDCTLSKCAEILVERYNQWLIGGWDARNYDSDGNVIKAKE